MDDNEVVSIFQDSEQDEGKTRSKKEVKVDEHPQELGLGFVQISVTAATPMVEDADKSFLDNIIKEEDESELEEEEEAEAAEAAKRESQQLQRNPELEKEVAEAVDEIIEEAETSSV